MLRRQILSQQVELPSGFSGDTLIHMRTGTRPLATVMPGDRVVSYCCGLQTVRAVSVFSGRQAQAIKPLQVQISNVETTCMTANCHLLINKNLSLKMSGDPELLAMAEELNADTIAVQRQVIVKPFFALHFDQPAIVYAKALFWGTSFQSPSISNVLPLPWSRTHGFLNAAETRMLVQYICAAQIF